MLVVGGEINIGIPGVTEIFEQKNEAALIGLAARQLELGAKMVGINVNGRPNEHEDMLWAVKVIQNRLEVPLSFDTSSLELFEKSLRVHDHRWGKPLLNSTTADPDRLFPTCRLAAEHGVPLAALPTRKSEKAAAVDQRLKLTGEITAAAEQAGLPLDKLYVDPMLAPVSVAEDNGRIFLDTLAAIKKNFPEVRTICGLDNVSFGLPGRELLSASFLAMAMAGGLDGVILKTNPLHYGVLRSSRVILGMDPACGEYIEAFRSGVWDKLLEQS